MFENVEIYFHNGRRNFFSDVELLKEVWLKVHGYKNVWANCFFCDYSHSRRSSDGSFQPLCTGCPAKKIQSDFNCGDCPNYDENPVEFYKLLVKLNNKRLKKGKK